MVVIGVVGVLTLPLVLMESVCGKILEGGGTLYLGVVLLLSLTTILNYLGFVVEKRLVWRI